VVTSAFPVRYTTGRSSVLFMMPAASMPSMSPGITMSMSRRSGSCSRAVVMASFADADTPITSYPNWHRVDLMCMPMIASSSTTRIRCFLIVHLRGMTAGPVPPYCNIFFSATARSAIWYGFWMKPAIPFPANRCVISCSLYPLDMITVTFFRMRRSSR